MREGIRGLIFAGLSVLAASLCAHAPATSHAADPPVTSRFPSRVLRQTSFNIPFTVETATQPLEVQLYVSRDRGASWDLYARLNPSARFFPFQAAADGEYWFASQTIDATHSPTELAGRRPELHVIVDTAQPVFDFRALVGAADQVQLIWRCTDPTIDAESLKIEYQAGREQPWHPVNVAPAVTRESISGRHSFAPQTAWSELQVRAEVSDLAGNKAVVTRRLSRSGATSYAARRPSAVTRWPGAGLAPTAAGQPADTQQANRPVALPPTQGNPSPPSPSAERPSMPNGIRGFQYPVSFGRSAPEYGGAANGYPAATRGVPADPYANARPSSRTNDGGGADLHQEAASDGATYGAGPTGADGRPIAAYPPGETPTSAQLPVTGPGSQQALNNRGAYDGASDAGAANDGGPVTEWKATETATGAANIYGGITTQSDDSSAGSNWAGRRGDEGASSQVDRLVAPQTNSPQTRLPQSAPARAGIEAAAATDRPQTQPELDATRPSPLRSGSNQVRVRPAVRMTSALRFELDYEFDAAAANGVRSVELWGTRDEGETWSRWKVDEDRRSPMHVEMDGEGVYGFRIVIVGNNGLAGRAPRNGEDAELWVGVDTTSPEVRITTATYGQGEHAGKLEIRWEAVDAHFDERPISISYSDHVAGPWTTIAAEVANTGQYYWPIDPRVPEQLYLRLEARDQAGNHSEYRLPDPVNLAGFTPKARIRGIRPLRQAPDSNRADQDQGPQATRNPYFAR